MCWFANRTLPCETSHLIITNKWITSFIPYILWMYNINDSLMFICNHSYFFYIRTKNECLNKIEQKDIRNNFLNAITHWRGGNKRNLNFRHTNIDIVHLYLFLAKVQTHTYAHTMKSHQINWKLKTTEQKWGNYPH